MSSANGKEVEAGSCGTKGRVAVSGVPVDARCTIAVCACVQLVQTVHTGGQLVSAVSSGQGSGHAAANTIPPSNCTAMRARSVNESARRDIRRELYHNGRRCAAAQRRVRDGSSHAVRRGVAVPGSGPFRVWNAGVP